MATNPQAWLSIRRLSIGFAILFAVIVTAVASGLVALSNSVRRSVVSMEINIRGAATAQQIDMLLREHQRLEDVRVVTHDPEAEALRAGVESDLRAALVQMNAYTETVAEARLLERLVERIHGYLTLRQTLANQNANPSETLRVLRPQLDLALESSAQLRKQNEAELDDSRRDAEREIRLENQSAFSVSLLIAAALLAMALGVHLRILRPLLGVQNAMQGFRGGAANARARSGGLVEMRQLADGFNAMAETIERQNRDRATFLSAVAHDLRSPLTAMLATLQMLQHNVVELTPQRMQLLDKQLRRINRMVDDLLDAARIESGHLQLRIEDFDLRAVAEAAVRLYQASTTKHQLRMHAPADLVVVHADPVRIEQVIGNLVSNAIKYSPAGGPVDVTLAVEGKEAVLSVADRGVGIAPEDLATVFAPFHRSAEVAEHIPGVGLGLSIARTLVEAHGGRIEVESKLGEGTTFRVRLPLAG